MSDSINWSETVTGKLGVYHKIPTPNSTNTSECMSQCALYRGDDMNRCPHRRGSASGSLDCTIRSERMRFVWALGAPDYSRFDEGGVV